jgi:HNH endonuclease
MLTQETVRELFDYRADGRLIWKVGGGRWGKSHPPGSVAGTESRGYILIRYNDILYRAHRLIWVWHYGPLSQELDHINGNGLDNRIENLRAVTRSQNNWNREGIRGTSFIKATRKWRASIYVGDRQKHLGTFATEQLAHAAYLEAKAKLHVIDGSVANCFRS